MDDNRNWQGWVALALAGLALVIALFGRTAPPPVNVMVNNGPGAAQPAAPAPPFKPGRPARPDVSPGWPEPPFGGKFQQGPPDGAPGFGRWEQHGPWAEQPGFGDKRDFGPPRGHGHFHPFFFGPFFALFGLIKLAGIALVAWLAFRFFQNRRDRPSEG